MVMEAAISPPLLVSASVVQPAGFVTAKKKRMFIYKTTPINLSYMFLELYALYVIFPF